MKLEGNAGVRHLVALASMALESSASPGGPTRAPSAPEAGTQSSRHTDGTLHWAVQLISCGLWKYGPIGVQCHRHSGAFAAPRVCRDCCTQAAHRLGRTTIQQRSGVVSWLCTCRGCSEPLQ